MSMASSGSLPVRQQKARIVDKVQLNRVTLIVAETGSGKSSQVPQMLLEEGFSPLLCTQPRRLAVVAISKVVAKERGCQLGEEVGYHIGQKKVISPRSKIIFETAGVLLEELRCGGGKVLSRYKVIILDEVHERSIESDLTLTCIKQFMLRNGNIRLVLMSATFDYNIYRDYFKDLDRGERVEIIPVSNSAADRHSVQFKCELNYLEEVIALLDVKRADRWDLESTFASFEEENGLGKHIQQMITDLVTHLHRNEEDLKKNILIFLPTYKALEQQWSLLKRKGLDMKVFVLHSSIDMDHSIQAMEVSLPFRKVILATNVAESSVTIPGISYVIDSCRSLEIYWNNERKKRVPRLVWVSKSQANQRKGRTGRTCDGQVFRMVPKDVYNSFTEFERPAIQLLSLREQVLTISCAESKAINDPMVLFSKSLDPPNNLTIQNALDTLKSVQALKLSQQRGKYFPTGYGKLLASLPLSLESAILVVKGGQLGLLRETAVLAALMDSSPFPIVHPFGYETQYQTYLERYYQRQASAYGETSKFSHVSILLANLHAFEFWQCTMKDKQRLERLMKYASHLNSRNSDEFVFSEIGEQLWCAQHHLSPSALHAIAEISATIIEKMHLFRPKFLGQLQGPPTYYSAYDFQHSCEFYPDGENLMENIILLEDQPDCESGVCYKDEFVTSGQFRPFKEIEILRKLIGQVQRDYLQETNCMEQEGEESLDEATSLCRYFQRGVCNKGSECQFSHDLTARRSLCKYFMTESGCRYGEMCEFRHMGSTQFSSIQDSPVYFEEDPPSTNGFSELLPHSDQGNILVYGEEDFSFTWNLSGHYTPEKILAASVNPREAVYTTGKTAVKDRVAQLSTAGVKIVWDVELCSLQTEDSPVIPWNEIECVLWTIRREKNDETLAKRLLDFFSSLSVILLSQGLADITVLLTMYTDQYVRCQVERVARDCFFFLVKSIPFDMVAFGVYSHSEAPVFGEPKPVTYVFELLPPSALLHGEYFWHLQQALEA